MPPIEARNSMLPAMCISPPCTNMELNKVVINRGELAGLASHSTRQCGTTASRSYISSDSDPEKVSTCPVSHTMTPNTITFARTSRATTGFMVSDAHAGIET